MTTEDRLEKLELELATAKRANRWLLTIMGFAVVGLALAGMWTKSIAIAQDQRTAATQKIVSANMFSLVDDNGKVCAILGATKDGPGLALYDQNDKVRVQLEVRRGTPALCLNDANEKHAVMLIAAKDGAGLNLYSESGQGDATLNVTKDGPAVLLTDGDGKTRAWLRSIKGGPAMMKLYDQNGKTRAGLSVTKDGSAFAMFDESAKLRVSMGAQQIVQPDGTKNEDLGSFLRLFGPDGKALWSAP